MDVIVNEFSNGENTATVNFNEVSLTNGAEYKSEENGLFGTDATYVLEQNNTELLPDYNSNDNKPKYTLNVEMGIIADSSLQSGEYSEGEKIKLITYVPENAAFYGWESSEGSSVFDDTMAVTVVLTMPANDITVRANVIQEIIDSTSDSTTESTTGSTTESSTESTTEITTESSSENTTESTTNVPDVDPNPITSSETTTFTATTESSTETTTETTTESTTDTQSDKGDVNGDNNINFNDAIIVLRHSSGSITLTDDQIYAADMNSDGNINFNDAILILRKASAS